MVKNPPTNAGDKRDVGSIPGLGRSPEKGKATHCSILAWDRGQSSLSMDRGAWQATVHAVAKKSDTIEAT